MPPHLRDLYETLIPKVRQGIADHFPETSTPEFFEQVTGVPEVFAQDHAAIDKYILEPTHMYLERSGKVLRPILAAMTLKAYGKNPLDYLQFLGSIEVMEDSSIMMDDYIDNSEIRRGGPCAHKVYGFPLANLASCTAFALSHYQIYNNGMNLPLAESVRLNTAVTWEHVQMAYGQIEELYWTERDINDVNLDQYLQETIARCAFLSFRGPLRYAGLLGHAPDEDIPKLEKLGDALLIGYHIRGDNLDMSPDSPEWGKIAGEDITTGRRTLLINYILGKTDPDERRWLEEVLASRTSNPDIKQRVFDLVTKYDGFGFTRKLAAEYDQKAKDLAGSLQISDEDKALFHEFSEFACNRRVA
jgi:geranylgeranyl diphosphate synthase type I/geranylgeranyl diphosphate synthase type II